MHARTRSRGGPGIVPALLYLGIGAAIAAPAGLAAQAAPAAVPERDAPQLGPSDSVPGAVDAYLSRLEPFGLSGAVLVARGGEPVLARGFGPADRETGRPWTAGTVSSVGSITKQFTAAAIMVLEEEGRLSVRDSLGAFFDDVPADKRAITLHHLLTHTSGLSGLEEGDFDFVGRDELVRKALASELLWEPGTRYRYSNLGYSLLGAVVEVVTGSGYEAWIRRRLFQPAGMYETGYLLPAFQPERLAVGYRGNRRWGTVIERLDPQTGPSWILRANGGIHTTVYDMWRWIRALTRSERIVSRAQRAKMFSPHADEEVGSWYGYGWVVDTTSRGTPVHWHDGGNGILFADLHLFPEEETTTFMMTSAAEVPATALLDLVDRVIFGQEVAMPPRVEPTDVPPERLESLAGRYALEGGGAVVVERSGAQLEIRVEGQPAVDRFWPGGRVGRVPYEELNRRAPELVRAIEAGDFEILRQAMGPDAPEEPYRSVGERWREMGGIQEVEVLGTLPAWFHGGSATATWVRLRMDRGGGIRRIHWSADGRLAGLGGMVYPAPVSFRCAMTAPEACTGFHPELRVAPPELVFGSHAAGGTPTELVLDLASGERLVGIRGE